MQDYHAGAVIEHMVVDGMPVLIHQGGRYPSLIDETGRTTRDAMHVSVWVGGTSDGYGRRVPGTRVDVHVHAHDGVNVSRRVYEIVTFDEEEAIAQAKTRICEATVAARTLRADKAAHDAALLDVRNEPASMTRDQYEAACARFGVTALPEDKVGIRADAYWPNHSVEDCTLYILAARRESGRLDEQRACEDADEAARVAARLELIGKLRGQPVSRTVTMLLVGHVVDEQPRRGELWTAVGFGRDVMIDEDAPSLHGEHLLGYDGSTGREVTFEIRTLPSTVS